MKIYPNDSVYPDPMRGAEKSFVNQRPGLHGIGMSIRTELAARAMEGIIASGANHDTKEDVAKIAVAMADALIKELNKPTE